MPHGSGFKCGEHAWVEWGAALWRVCLRDADLSGANLHSANMGGADLRGADLTGANLGGAIYTMRGWVSTLRGARYDARTRWPKRFDPRKAGATRVE